jgi:hypothetical protein
MIVHENVEISVDIDSGDYITLVNKRSGVEIRVMTAGTSFLVDTNNHKVRITKNNKVVIIY